MSQFLRVFLTQEEETLFTLWTEAHSADNHFTQSYSGGSTGIHSVNPTLGLLMEYMYDKNYCTCTPLVTQPQNR